MPKWLLIVLLWTAGSLVQANPKLQELELNQAHRLQWPGNYQPSGLAWCRGQFLTVSDRHDLEIQAIHLNPDGRAQVTRYLELSRIPEPPALNGFMNMIRQMILTLFQKQYDWEGISCDEAGNLYLASEAYNALLKEPPKRDSEWITLGPHPVIQERGLLSQPNAGFEGVEWLGNNEFILTAEMHPAGLIRCKLQGEVCQPTRVGVVSDQKLPLEVRTWDLSGLSAADGRLYVLERYYSRVCRRDWVSFQIERCFSFRATEKGELYNHENAKWGQAEGLLVKDDRIFVVIDNNGRGLVSEPGSTDTWLFEFQRPQDF